MNFEMLPDTYTVGNWGSLDSVKMMPLYASNLLAIGGTFHLWPTDSRTQTFHGHSSVTDSDATMI